jgi:hypothetical protein
MTSREPGADRFLERPLHHTARRPSLLVTDHIHQHPPRIRLGRPLCRAPATHRTQQRQLQQILGSSTLTRQ